MHRIEGVGKEAGEQAGSEDQPRSKARSLELGISAMQADVWLEPGGCQQYEPHEGGDLRQHHDARVLSRSLSVHRQRLMKIVRLSRGSRGPIADKLKVTGNEQQLGMISTDLSTSLACRGVDRTSSCAFEGFRIGRDWTAGLEGMTVIEVKASGRQC